jgi:hypothetical protein
MRLQPSRDSRFKNIFHDFQRRLVHRRKIAVRSAVVLEFELEAKHSIAIDSFPRFAGNSLASDSSTLSTSVRSDSIILFDAKSAVCEHLIDTLIPLRMPF